MKHADFSTVTEVPGLRITLEAAAMEYSRYTLAATHCADKDVLEVACGAGLGLGLLAHRARRVVGGDVTLPLIRMAHQHYRGRIHLIGLDAAALPFAETSFDVVILYEAIYYLPDAEAFLAECRRVQRPGGEVIVCSVNCEWPGFHPSPFSTRYYSAAELAALLERHGFRATLWGAFPATSASPAGRLTSFVRRLAVRWHLIPKTMRGKTLLKRMFYGRLMATPRELTGGVEQAAPLSRLDSSGPVPTFKVIYAIGRLASGE